MATRRTKAEKAEEAKAEAAVSDRHFMQEQAALDESESRYGRARSEIKETAGFIDEANRRIRACRAASTTAAAQAHDLRRIIELCSEISDSATKALDLLDI